MQLNERITRLTEGRSDGTRKLLAKEIIDYRNAANDKLEKLVDADIIKPHEKETLVEAAINIETYLKNKDEKVSEEVKQMGDENYIAWSDQLRMEGQELGIEKGRELGREEGMEKGIEVLILDNLEDGKSEEQIISKVVKRFNVSETKAKEYFDRFAVVCC